MPAEIVQPQVATKPNSNQFNKYQIIHASIIGPNARITIYHFLKKSFLNPHAELALIGNISKITAKVSNSILIPLHSLYGRLRFGLFGSSVLQ